MTFKNKFKSCLIIVFMLSVIQMAFAQNNPTVKWKDGKKYIVHTIRKGDTWSSIARTYKAPIKDLQKVNPNSKELKFDQTILIPYEVFKKSENKRNAAENKVETDTNNDTPKSDSPEQQEAKKPSASAGIKTEKSEVMNKEKSGSKKKNPAIVHKVVAGETLYGIAAKYHVSPREIATYNSIELGKIKIGQLLKIPQKGEANLNTNDHLTTPVIKNQNESVETKKDSVAIQSNVTSTIDSSNYATVPTASDKNIDGVVTEQGVATWLLDGTSGKREKFYALHRTAPVGTIIKVMNPMSKRFVFVKVVGVLPDTGDNFDVLIKITQSAARRIGIIDARFRVEISYGVKEK